MTPSQRNRLERSPSDALARAGDAGAAGGPGQRRQESPARRVSCGSIHLGGRGVVRSGRCYHRLLQLDVRPTTLRDTSTNLRYAQTQMALQRYVDWRRAATSAQRRRAAEAGASTVKAYLAVTFDLPIRYVTSAARPSRYFKLHPRRLRLSVTTTW